MLLNGVAENGVVQKQEVGKLGILQIFAVAGRGGTGSAETR